MSKTRRTWCVHAASRCAYGAHTVRIRCAYGAHAVRSAACVQLSEAAHVLEHVFAALVAAVAELAFDGAEVHRMLHHLRIVVTADCRIVKRLCKRCGSLHIQQFVHNANVLLH